MKRFKKLHRKIFTHHIPKHDKSGNVTYARVKNQNYISLRQFIRELSGMDYASLIPTVKVTKIRSSGWGH